MTWSSVVKRQHVPAWEISATLVLYPVTMSFATINSTKLVVWAVIGF